MGYKSEIDLEKDDEKEEVLASAQFKVKDTEFEIEGVEDIENMFESDLKILEEKGSE